MSEKKPTPEDLWQRVCDLLPQGTGHDYYIANDLRQPTRELEKGVRSAVCKVFQELLDEGAEPVMQPMLRRAIHRMFGHYKDPKGYGGCEHKFLIIENDSSCFDWYVKCSSCVAAGGMMTDEIWEWDRENQIFVGIDPGVPGTDHTVVATSGVTVKWKTPELISLSADIELACGKDLGVIGARYDLPRQIDQGNLEPDTEYRNRIRTAAGIPIPKGFTPVPNYFQGQIDKMNKTIAKESKKLQGAFGIDPRKFYVPTYDQIAGRSWTCRMCSLEGFKVDLVLGERPTCPRCFSSALDLTFDAPKNVSVTMDESLDLKESDIDEVAKRVLMYPNRVVTSQSLGCFPGEIIGSDRDGARTVGDVGRIAREAAFRTREMGQPSAVAEAPEHNARRNKVQLMDMDSWLEDV